MHKYMTEQVLTFKYRLLLRRGQHKALGRILEDQRILYNACLEERNGCYRATGKGRSYMQQSKALTQLRREPEYAAVPVKLQRWTLKRADDAYQAFFRRCKTKGGKAGFPRFRGQGRWQSFGFAEFSGIRLDGKRLRFAGLSLYMHLHRPLPEGRPLSCTFTRDQKGWNVCLQYRVLCRALPATGQQVGVDVGLKELAVLSTGVPAVKSGPLRLIAMWPLRPIAVISERKTLRLTKSLRKKLRRQEPTLASLPPHRNCSIALWSLLTPKAIARFTNVR
jgi:putative transposase